MTKNSLRSAATMILVTTALAWGLPVNAEDMRAAGRDRENTADADSAAIHANAQPERLRHADSDAAGEQERAPR